MMMEAQGARRRGGKAPQGGKTKSRLCNAPHGLPSCWTTRPSTDCSRRKEKKLTRKQENLRSIPPHGPTQTHTHTHSIPTCTSLQNSGLAHRSDVRGGGVTQIPQILLFMHSSQLHPSPTQPPTHSLQHQVPPIYVSRWTSAFITHTRRLTNSDLQTVHKQVWLLLCKAIYPK